MTLPLLQEAAKETPLIELLRSVPANAVLRIDTPNPLGVDTRSIPVGRLCHDAAAALALPVPIDMVLLCPKCGVQHIDAPEEGTMTMDFSQPPLWTNPPHKSHLCHGCGHIWRPADVPTNGVAAVKTTGKADSPLALPVAATVQQPDYLGLPFAEARRRILDMPLEEARGMAVSLLIQNGILRRYASPEVAATQEMSEVLVLLIGHDGSDSPLVALARNRAELLEQVKVAVWGEPHPADTTNDAGDDMAEGITDKLLETGLMAFEGDPPLRLVRIPVEGWATPLVAVQAQPTPIADLRDAKWLDAECAHAGACQSLRFKAAQPTPAPIEPSEQFAPNHKLCYRCQGSGRERGRFLGVDPGNCMDCGGKGVVFKPTPPSAAHPAGGAQPNDR